MRSVVIAVVVVLMALETTAKAAKPPHCGPRTCRLGCYKGKGLNGCSTCDCPPSCEGVSCDPGQVCELQRVNCFMQPCFDQPTCVDKQETTPSCRLFKCLSDCYSPTGEDGCPSHCECPCQTMKCSAGYQCKLVEVQCIKAPCYPVGECVPETKECPPQDPCNIRCSTSLQKDENGCQLCKCSPPSSSTE